MLVSRCYVASKCEEAAAPAVAAVEGSTDYGAVYTGQSASFEAPPPYGEYRLSSPPGASLSADGSTVAWMGEDIGQQAALLSEETRNPDYTEPLWRRIAPGSETITERVTGGSDPANPACASVARAACPRVPLHPIPARARSWWKTRVIPPGSSTKTGGRPATSCRA